MDEEKLLDEIRSWCDGWCFDNKTALEMIREYAESYHAKKCAECKHTVWCATCGDPITIGVCENCVPDMFDNNHKPLA